MADDDNNDDLLKRARELSDKAGRIDRDTDDNHSSASERLVRDNLLFRGISSFANKLRKYLGPLGSLIAWLLGLVLRWLRWAAMKSPDGPAIESPSDATFSMRQFAQRLAITVVVLFAIHVVFRAAYYYGTYFEETVYVTGKQEIVTGELYQFGGCTSLPCSTESDNGKFYLIESSLYLPVMYYPEENVFANVPQQDAACDVEGYGFYFRSLRWVYKSLQLYQHVVDVSCRPYTDEETRQAIRDGVIVKD